MNKTLMMRGRLYDLSRPLVMGIMNVTPDSFYAGSRQQTEAAIVARTEAIIAEGGTLIDVGAFSTRPGATEVSKAEEMSRLRFALEIVQKHRGDGVVSVDTFRPDVARMAVEEYGADMINDVSEGGVTGVANQPLAAGDDDCPAMFRMAARLQVPYVLMSVRGTLEELMISTASKVQQLRGLGVKDIILDPGFGFGKTLEQNYRLLFEMDKLQELGLPILVGLSRKSMIYQRLGGTPETSLNGTTVLNTVALMKGANILRVHDVREAVEAGKLFQVTSDK
ncbi:MAG: dihydropteroate synthase [Prevotella sp.]|nr:dihydropteroate synthase [Prevotella sp.]